MNVAILGASPKPERFANKAQRILLEHGHTVFPINPAYDEIEGTPSLPALDAIAPGIADTITVYMKAERTRGLGPSIIRAKPRRVIFNPGAENATLEKELGRAGIVTIDDCTLVMLRTGTF